MTGASQSNIGNAQSANARWVKPSAPLVKVNVDAARNEQGEGSFGGVMRDSSGSSLVAWAGKLPLTSSIEMAEALAIKESLKLISSWNFGLICLESDSKLVISFLQRNVSIPSQIGIILDDILSLSSNFPTCNFFWVPRLGNSVAHNLAKLGDELPNVTVWWETPPSPIADVLHFDAFY